jgi:DMSO/TMAO reductase YedYZ molybdopterin-dependent catalytic subunit
MNPSRSEEELRLRRLTRRGFLTGGLAFGAAAGFFGWLYNADREDNVPWPLRRVLGFNERVGRAAFRRGRLAPEFPAGRAAEPRVNGRIGLAAASGPAGWRLTAESEGRPRLHLSLDELKALPKAEMVTELKCIEGWSEVVHWGGVRLLDFARHYGLGTASGAAPDPDHAAADLLPYVALETPPDGGGDRYYVGLDAESAYHPQTLLCYEMNGEALTPGHGAPLRLVVPVKYGIKSIKHIGTVRFTKDRPADYWAERGYDWYAGH